MTAEVPVETGQPPQWRARVALVLLVAAFVAGIGAGIYVGIANSHGWDLSAIHLGKYILYVATAMGVLCPGFFTWHLNQKSKYGWALGLIVSTTFGLMVLVFGSPSFTAMFTRFLESLPF